MFPRCFQTVRPPIAMPRSRSTQSWYRNQVAMGKLAPAQTDPRDTYRDAPVDHQHDGPAGEDALAPLELEHAGVHMPQQAKEPGPVLGQRHRFGGCVDDVCGEPHRQHRLEHISQDHYCGQRPAKGAVEVSQPRVAAAMIAHIVPQNILGYDDCPIEAAAEVGKRRNQDEGPEFDRVRHRSLLLIALLTDGHFDGGTLQTEYTAYLIL